MSKDTALIIGARSDIAISAAHCFAKEGYDIQLAARNKSSLNADKSDIELRYQVGVSLYNFDALDIDSHEHFVSSLPKLPIVAICAVGYMGVQTKNERDLLAAVNVMRSNFEGPASILAVLANHFEQRGSGTLVGISSVAGERGRAKNYVYGSAKAGFSAFLFGKYLHNTWLYEFMKKNIIGKYERKIHAYGWLVIVVAAITPIPFSATCAVVGAVGFKRNKYLFYSLARFLRYAIYGFFIWLAHPF